MNLKNSGDSMGFEPISNTALHITFLSNQVLVFEERGKPECLHGEKPVGTEYRENKQTQHAYDTKSGY